MTSTHDMHQTNVVLLILKILFEHFLLVHREDLRVSPYIADLLAGDSDGRLLKALTGFLIAGKFDEEMNTIILGF